MTDVARVHCMLDTSGYKYTNWGCVTLIAFLLQQWLHERASVLSYTHIACIVNYILFVCRPSWRKFKTEYWQSFVKIDAVGSVLYIILYTELLNCLSDLTKIPYCGYLHSVVKLVWNFWESVSRESAFGRNELLIVSSVSFDRLRRNSMQMSRVNHWNRGICQIS